ncbi:hypothetical protein Tco_1050943 [Tanacetum coccineum]
MFDTLGVPINGLRTRIDNTLLEDRQRIWMFDSQNSLREIYKIDVIPMSASLSKNLKELKEELIEELLKAELEKSLSDSKDIQANLLKRIKILENDFKRSQAQSIDFELKLQHQKEKMACDVSWKSKLSTINDENVLLKTQVDSIVKERENIKLEYQKLFNSIKATRTQHQKELDELIEHINQKTHAYADVRVQNQDLLITILELKNKLRIIDKGKCVESSNSKMPRSASIGSNNHETKNLNACQSNASVLSSKTVKAVNDDSNIIYVSCGKDMFLLSHEKCVARYALSRSSSVIQLVFWIVDSGCSKHMTRNLQLLRNFVEKFMGTIRFGNDHFAAITRYGDYIHGNLMICHVYYVEGLGHNLFLVGQFCDGDLEVAFHLNTCYVWNLEGDDLLTDSHDSNL